jgi:membrane fusion protein (multidrug efflux system)
MSSTMKRIALGLGAVVILGLLALPKLLPSNDGTAAPPPSQRGGSLSVQVSVVQPEPLEDKIVTTGTVLANEEVALRSEVSGRVEAITFEEGRAVQQGDLLLQLNDADLQAQRKQAAFRLKLARDREARQAKLLEKGGVSQEEYEATQNEVNVLEAELDLIDVQIDKTSLRAPFSGVIGLRSVSVGSYLTPSETVATLKDLDPVKVEFSIPERYAQRVDVGDRIAFTVEGLPGTYEGTIYAYEPRIDQDTRTLRIRATSPNPQGTLLPGAFADIELIFEEIEDAITVPAIAVIPELGGKKVFVVEDGAAASRSVTTGIRTADRLQVTEGLAPGDTVIVTGIQQLRPGLPVQIVDRGAGLIEAPTG